MRQIGTILNEADAQRFSAYLLTQNIAAHAEQEPDGWAIWVRDEDQMEQATGELEQFRVDPKDTRYQGAEREAESIRRDEVRRREQIRKNIVVMGGRWRQGAARRAPLVFTLIALSVAATIWTGFGQNTNFEQLQFCQSAHAKSPEWSDKNLGDKLIDIRRGQIWRLITPIFVHLDFMHLVMNMFWTYFLGSMIEDRKGALRVGLMVLAIAVISNVAQAWMKTPWFGGMSGVIFGFFGYAWMKTLYDPSAGIRLGRFTIVFVIIYFFYCLSPYGGPIANTAHGAGLVVGAAIGYAPVFAKSLKER